MSDLTKNCSKTRTLINGLQLLYNYMKSTSINTVWHTKNNTVIRDIPHEQYGCHYMEMLQEKFEIFFLAGKIHS